MEDKPRETPTPEALRSFADPADIATVFDRLGYQPPASRATKSQTTPARAYIDANVLLSVDTLKRARTCKPIDWYDRLRELLGSATDGQTFTAGSHAHGTIVRATTDLLVDVLDGQHRREAMTTWAWLPSLISDATTAVPSPWFEAIHFYWNLTSRWQRSPAVVTEGQDDARVLLFLLADLGREPMTKGASPTKALHFSGHGAASDVSPDFFLQSEDGTVLLVQSKTMAGHRLGKTSRARREEACILLVCSTGRSDDEAAVFQLSGAHEKDWRREPIHATRLPELSN